MGFSPFRAVFYWPFNSLIHLTAVTSTPWLNSCHPLLHVCMQRFCFQILFSVPALYKHLHIWWINSLGWKYAFINTSSKVICCYWGSGHPLTKIWFYTRAWLLVIYFFIFFSSAIEIYTLIASPLCSSVTFICVYNVQWAVLRCQLISL